MSDAVSGVRRTLAAVHCVIENGTGWLTPVATLAAVFVGAFLSWLAQRALTTRREEGETKAAARMLAGDLAMRASRLKDMVVDDPHWYGFDDLRLPYCWDRGAPIVALHTDDETWQAISQSALELAYFTEGMIKAMAPGGPRHGETSIMFTDQHQAELRAAWKNATSAYNALARLAGTEPEPGLLHERGPDSPGG
jgi:hypothetical protein